MNRKRVNESEGERDARSAFFGECVYLDAQKHPRRALQRHSLLLDQREGKMKRRSFCKVGKEGCKAEIERAEDDGAGVSNQEL